MLRPHVVADQVDRLAQPAGRGGDVHVAGHRFAADLDVGRIAAGLGRFSRLAELQPHVIRLPGRHGKVGGEVAAVDPVAVKLGVRRAAHLVELRLRPERRGHQVGKGAQAHDELGGRAPDVAGGIDVVFAADAAKDDALRPARAAAGAEAVFPLCGRPLDGVQINPRAGRERIFRPQGRNLQAVLPLGQSVLIAEDLLIAGLRAPEVDAAKLLCAIEVHVGLAAAGVGPADQPDLIAGEIQPRPRRRAKRRGVCPPRRRHTLPSPRGLHTGAARAGASPADRRPRPRCRGSRRGGSSR